MGSRKNTGQLNSDNVVINSKEIVTQRDRQRFVFFIRDLINSVSNPQDSGIEEYTSDDKDIVDDAMTKAIYDINSSGIVDSSSSTIIVAKKGIAGTINIGEILYITGQLKVEKVDNTFSTGVAIGIAIDSITDIDEGRVIVIGEIKDINTSGLILGPIWVGPIPGIGTQTFPVAEEKNQIVGLVTKVDSVNGSIVISPSDVKNVDSDFSIVDPTGFINVTTLNVQAALKELDTAIANSSSGNVLQESNTLNSDIDNFAITDIVNTGSIRFTLSGSDRDFTGIVAPVPAVGKSLFIFNADNNKTLKIQHDDGGSLAINRIMCPDNNEYKLDKNSGTTIVYDVTSNRWRIASLK